MTNTTRPDDDARMSQWLVNVGGGLRHAVRIALLLALAENPTTTLRLMQLADKLDVELGVVSYHLRYLLDAGLIEQTEGEPVRDAVPFDYHLTEQAEIIVNAARHAVQSRP